MTFIELAERCEAAEGPDRELDRAIELAIFPDRISPCPTVELLAYSASLDAAMTLVPEGWGRIELGRYVGGGEAGADRWCTLAFPDWEGDVLDVEAENCATEALALCAAALRARAAQ
jgi:hypothetical protein